VRGKSFQRWGEACLLLVSFGALSLWGIVSAYSTALEVSAGRKLGELAKATRGRPPRTLLEGELVGRIEIPRLDVSSVLLEGVSAATLRVAAGHMPRSALPGEAGNASIAAHRDSFFRNLGGIVPGDLVLVTTPGGKHSYRVSFTAIVRTRDTRLLQPTREETLTLITCYPFRYVGAAPKRFVVRAVRSEY
jgi:sortase A